MPVLCVNSVVEWFPISAMDTVPEYGSSDR